MENYTNHLMCPVLSCKNGTNSKQLCINKECSWWNDKEKCCVVWSFLNSIQQVTEQGTTSLDDIYRIMKQNR